MEEKLAIFLSILVVMNLPETQSAASAAPSTCPPSNFTCSSGQCVPSSFRCDDEDDCADGSDEIGCAKICKALEFKCDNGRCISRDFRCDHEDDCNDMSDERGCGRGTCSPKEFACSLSKRCIPARYICDGNSDCIDGSDEKGCQNARDRTCEAAEFKCDNGRCISRDFRCDHEDDCNDMSDERGCASAGPSTCPPTNFTCSSGQCVPSSFRCDDEDDCVDGSDEIGCAKTCKALEFQCDNGRCISGDFRCDHEDDCNDMSDERGCAIGTCSPAEFACSLSKRCIPARYRCDGNSDCIDGSDEKNCQNVTKPTKPPVSCRKNERMCDDGSRCVHSNWICDGSKDCNDGSDEKNCGTIGCTKQEFTCSNQKCIPKKQRCDGKDNCGDNSDEKSCPTSAPTLKPLPPIVLANGNYSISINSTRIPGCSANFFQCPGSKKCIPESKVCDNTPNCEHGEDERNCYINECLSHNGHCLHFCTDTKTSFYCSCKPGYELMEDRKSCRDINECEIPGMCSQNCFDYKGGYKCSCLDGYLLEPDKKRCKADGPRPFLMFSNRNSIRLIMTDGKEYKQALKNLHDAQALGFDVQETMVYWTDGQHSTILRAKALGSNPSSKIEKVINEGIIDASGLAIDWVGRKIYWTDSGSNSILVAEMDGKLKKTLLSDGLDKPSSIVVDPSERVMYWIDWGSPAKIVRASMDGTQRRVLISGDHIERPSGLAIDYTTRKLYWVDSKLKSIKHCSLNGTAIRELVSEGLKNPSAITVFEDEIYWTDTRTIYKANKFTGQNRTVLIHNAASPQDAHIYHRQRQPSGSNPCGANNGGCTHLCLLSSKTPGFSCSCPDGLYLQKDSKTCAKDKPPTVKPTIEQLSTSNAHVKGSRYDEKTKSSVDAGLIIGLVVGALLIIISILIVIFFMTKRRRTQKLEILYNANSENDVDKIMSNGTARHAKKPEIKNRNEYKHFANVNYDPNDPNEPQTPPHEKDDELEDVNIEVDETSPVIRNSVV